MATAFKGIRVSPEQYLEAEMNSEVRHEFANGFVVAQAGASRIHNLIAVTVSSLLRATWESEFSIECRLNVLTYLFYILSKEPKQTAFGFLYTFYTA